MIRTIVAKSSDTSQSIPLGSGRNYIEEKFFLKSWSAALHESLLIGDSEL